MKTLILICTALLLTGCMGKVPEGQEVVLVRKGLDLNTMIQIDNKLTEPELGEIKVEK